MLNCCCFRRVIYMACFATFIAASNGSHMGVATTIWGITVAFSRALLGRHYLGDVCAGAIVGMLNTALITKVRFALLYTSAMSACI